MPCFYSLTLESQGSILSAIHGSYSAPKAHEIVVNRGRYLELLRFDVTLGQTYSICSIDTFSLIRNISNLRVLGSGRDLVVVTSDSGNIVILSFNSETNLFERLHSEPYGKSGCRRIIPGHYLAVDPMGRSIMIAAIERQKLVYTLTRKSKGAETLDISSPMEAHKSHMICFSLAALDVGYENPLFATIEQSYSNDKNIAYDNDKTGIESKKQLIYWEVDLGLNYILRKSSQEISNSSHLLLSVPGGSDGPGGVLVCDGIGITYCKIGCSNIFCPFPIRFGEVPESGIIIVASALHKLKGFFFILLQTELGDIYRVHFSHDEGVVREIKIFYYDTIPVCNSLLVLRSGYLFAAHEFGNHSNYQFISLGDDDTDPFTSSLDDSDKCVFFRLRNCNCIKKIEELPSLSPITDLKVLDINNDGCPQIVTSCGRGPRSTLRICSYGKNVEEVTSNPLPGRPRFIWTLKKGIDPSSTDSLNETYHNYIIISFIDRSLVLSIEEHVEETTDTLFVLGEATVHAASMVFYNSFIQVLESHVRYINNDIVFDWKTPDNRRIIAGDSNGRQVALGLEGGLIVILELGVSVTSGRASSSLPMCGNGLVEVCRREITSEIICIGLQQLCFSDQLRSNFVVVGTSAENTVRLYLISHSEKRLKQTSVQALPTTNSIPESVVLFHSQKNDKLYLLIGLTTGVILSCIINQSTGTIGSYRSKYLGTRGVHISRFIKEDSEGTRSSDNVVGKMGVICLTNKPWLVDFQANRLNYLPFQYKAVDSIAPLNTQQVSSGYVAVSGSTLVIFQLVHNYGESFSQNIIKLNYTPRKILVLPPPQLFTGLETLMASGTLDIPKNQMIAVIETDHNAFDFKTKKEILFELNKLYKADSENVEMVQEKMHDDEENEDNVNMEIEQKDDKNKGMSEYNNEFFIRVPGENGSLIPESEVSGFVAGDGKWGGCVRVVNLRATENQQIIHLDINEGCISSCVCKFDEMDLPCLVLGTVYGMNLRLGTDDNDSDSQFGAAIKVYRYDSNYNFELLHSTPVENAVTAMTGWRGRLLVGIGKNLRVYSLGKKKLLRKSEYRDIPESLSWIKVANDRIYAGDITSGVLVFKYNQLSNQFSIIAKEPFSRWITSACEVLDYHTVITSDKFDNITVSRVPLEASDENSFTSSLIDSTSTTSSVKSYQTNYVAQFHTGDIATCFQKTQLSALSVETIIYGTVLGSIGSLTPITNNDDIDLLLKLETLIRREKSTLLSRDQLMFRSYYSPVHNVIDGDFCQTFSALSQESQNKISSKLDMTVEEVYKKLDDMRARIFW
ncbi:putative spliceosome factor [Cryptosporidium bovis]|uniref:putative spliceosome factor n=1 Tax=Cryptosporidium bovis TaxID=310047 RepID=UPI003519E160|nr:putative spliceosome factor [Cryptosporidium bovis]